MSSKSRSKAKWGGRRPGAGRKRAKREKTTRSTEASGPAAPQPENLTPLEHMLKVMADPTADLDLRARMAIAAAPYVHPKVGETGKKEHKNEAARRVSSRFTTSAPPPPAKKTH